MIRIASHPSSTSPAWHARFLSLLPAIVAHARISFRHLPSEARAEAVQAVVCNACAATARLAELGKLDLAYAGPLARFGVVQVRAGRMTGGHLNCKDVASEHCRRVKGVVMERLDKYDEEENQWQEAVVQDNRAAPVPDIVAFRCDFPEWLQTLSRRDRRIAKTLALGHSTSLVAKRFEISPARVSQLRRELADSWKAFRGEAVPT